MLDFLVGVLAALGAVCVCRACYDLLFRLCADGRATLYLFVEGNEPCAEQLLRTAARFGSRYLPGMEVVLIDEGPGDEALRVLCERLGAGYYGG